ncbi:hypothetical protein J3R82DRAFT_590 [Butyriboletus roseoflavus]|nr:hypothetical protein J3R82DRAFT_590 [Butyriboletus roseoflavus]
MSALKLAVSALNRDKPHVSPPLLHTTSSPQSSSKSSITDWVEILSSPTYPDEAYDGIPELATSISLQSTGPSEASRAIRKKIKHGDNHQKYRALVILKALMENGDHKFQTACMDDQLVDAIKHLASDPTADTKVRRKLLSILASWNTQFKNDPSLSTIAGLYKQSRPIDRRSHGRSESADAQFRNDKDAAKKRAKQEKEDAKEKARKADEEARQNTVRSRRAPFDFEAEKPQILTSIANASQASSNLVNAIMLVNGDKENIVANPRVQECLQNAKTARKTIVRYIQLVENEDVIGTLIETNERVVSALQMYDNLSAPHTQDPTVGMRATMNGMTITPGGSERARQPSERSSDGHDTRDETRNASGYVHPDLQDLSFGGLGNEQGSLPPPIQPILRHEASTEAVWDQHRGSLSDFSDYESEEERQPHLAGPSSRGQSGDVEDPFADPFAD